jgi:hypothetical protein|tara:strand:+ start:908 stop:1171 length:264 start_codon:yes stop_codon:yes gene_type:complete
MIVAPINPRVVVVSCKKNKGGTQKIPKYTTYTEIKKVKKYDNKSDTNPIKKFLTSIFGEEIDYDKFKKESKYAIRVEENDDRKTKKW